MKIALVSPLAESVPPQLYGGTERVVSHLTEELVERGHDVTLFASGDSVTAARLVAGSTSALRMRPDIIDFQPYHLMMLEQVRGLASDIDIIHFHVDLLHFPLVGQLPCPTITTLHGRLDLPDLKPFYRAFPHVPVVSISESQRRPIPHANWAGTVHHGLPQNLLRLNEQPRGYLAFLGRISPEKRPDLAIRIAQRAGMRLKIAAKIDGADHKYWSDVILPLMATSKNVEFVGEIGERDKQDFLGNAEALLFPIDWEEPFGLVMIEAMACGTPVIAFQRGSVAEVVEDGVSGFIVGTVDEAVHAVSQVGALARAGVRAAFESRFTVGRMAADYLDIYAAAVARLVDAPGRSMQVAALAALGDVPGMPT
jgi:glycosyltransferase involved in cell wall biosynthesis